MKINKVSKRKNIKLIVALTLATIAAFAFGYGVYAKSFSQWPFEEKQQVQESTQLAESADKPSQKESGVSQSEVNDYKQKQYEDNNLTANTDPGKRQVQVDVTTFTQQDNEVQVSGYVTGVIEGDGTCTLTLTDALNKTASTSKTGSPNATNTTCGLMSIPLSELHSGKWEVAITYSSDSAEGSTLKGAIPPIEVKS